MIDKRLSCKDEWSVYTKLILMIKGDTCDFVMELLKRSALVI